METIGENSAGVMIDDSLQEEQHQIFIIQNGMEYIFQIDGISKDRNTK